jgi:hypothetical protein
MLGHHEVLPVLPRAERFPELPDAQVYFELAELTRRLTREIDGANPKTRRATVLGQALRHVERAAVALRPIAGLEGDEAAGAET